LLSVSEIKILIRKAVLSMEKFAVFCGSAYKHMGVKLLLDGVVDYLPSPLDRQEITVFSKEKEGEVSILNYPSTLALAFKITGLSFGGKLTFIRVYCGKISAGT
jgi:elongation factor G